MAQYLVKRKGCTILDYGLVDMAVAKRQRLQAALAEADPPAAEKCPLPLSLVDEYEVRPWNYSHKIDAG